MKEKIVTQPPQSLEDIKKQIRADSFLQILSILGRIPGQELPIITPFGWFEYQKTDSYKTELEILKNKKNCYLSSDELI